MMKTLFSSLAMALLVLSGNALQMSAISPGSRITVLGPGNKQVQLLAAKLACKAGYKATVVLDDQDQLNNARSLLYGRLYAREGKDDLDKVQFAVGGEEIGVALGISEGLIVVTQGSAPSNVLLEKSIAAGTKLKRVAMMSGHGNKLEAAEKVLANAAEAAGVEWSIARVGLLRGGGPGNVGREDDFGLDQYFYNTNPELNSFQKDKFSDQYQLGASLTPGNSLASQLNPFKYALAQNSFSVITEGNTNRITAGAVLVQALVQDACANRDFGLSAVRGLQPQSKQQWTAAFNELFSTDAEPVICQELEPPAGSVSAEGEEEMVEEPAKKYKLGASSRAEETLRKQQIGHLIPAVITAAAFLQGINTVALMNN